MYSAVVVQEVLQRSWDSWQWGAQWLAIRSWHNQFRGSSKLILLQLHKKLPKNILWSFNIWGKLERWKSWVPHELTTNQKNHHFEVLSSLILCHNEPLLDLIMTCNEKCILYNQWQLAQWRDWEEVPKHFPKPNFGRFGKRFWQKRSWSQFGDLIHYSFLNPGKTTPSEKYAQQIDEMHL